jgi:DNA-binding protein
MMENNESNENSVFIGKKDTMTYVFSVQTQANEHESIFIKARGNAISRAVDVSQISVDRFLKGWHIKDVKIGTEDRPTQPREGEEKTNETQRVSFIEIELSK